MKYKYNKGKGLNRAGLLAVLLLLTGVFSCQKEDRRGEALTVQQVDLSLASTNGKIDVPGVDFTQTADSIIVPIRLLFSDAVPKRFTVFLSPNDDTVNAMIAGHELDSAVLLTGDRYTLPGREDVLFGRDYYDVNLAVSITALERNYDKNLALALELSNPGKENKLDPVKKMAMITIRPAKIISPDQLRFVSFADAGELYEVPHAGGAYVQTSSQFFLPVNVAMTGEAGNGFGIHMQSNIDTLQKLIAAKDLPDTTVMLLENTDYSLPASMVLSAGKNEEAFPITIQAASLRKYYDKPLAIALNLTLPDAHLLDSAKRTIVMLLDPQKLVELDITDQHTGYSVQYENDNANENSPKLIDNNLDTKYLSREFDVHGSLWVQLEFPEAITTGAYTLTSANDAPERDPKNWLILGSNDGTAWETLDSRTDQFFVNRRETKKYTFPNDKAYRFYRWQVTANNGNSLFQCAEFRLIRRP